MRLLRVHRLLQLGHELGVLALHVLLLSGELHRESGHLFEAVARLPRKSVHLAELVLGRGDDGAQAHARVALLLEHLSGHQGGLLLEAGEGGGSLLPQEGRLGANRLLGC